MSTEAPKADALPGCATPRTSGNLANPPVSASPEVGAPELQEDISGQVGTETPAKVPHSDAPEAGDQGQGVVTPGWRHQPVICADPDGSTYLTLVEVHLAQADGPLEYWTEPRNSAPIGNDIDDLTGELMRMYVDAMCWEPVKYDALHIGKVFARTVSSDERQRLAGAFEAMGGALGTTKTANMDQGQAVHPLQAPYLPPFRYDAEGQYIWANGDQEVGPQMAADIRGWGALTGRIGLDQAEAHVRKDAFGQWVADTLNAAAAPAQPSALNPTPTSEMIDAGAERLVRFEDDAQWPDDFDPLDVAAARTLAERVWLSMSGAPAQADTGGEWRRAIAEAVANGIVAGKADPLQWREALIQIRKIVGPLPTPPQAGKADREEALARLAELGQEFDAARDESPVITEIAAERRRQIEAEGWTPEHDDTHDGGELSEAARAYLSACKWRLEEGPVIVHRCLPPCWPWDYSWFKPKDQRRDLIRAAALIVAEIERLDRAALKQEGE